MGECGEEDLWIAGERVPARSGRYASVADPATGEALARVAEAGVEDVGAAVAAARRSFEHGEWRRAPAPGRARGWFWAGGRCAGPGPGIARPRARAVPGRP